MLGHGLVKGVLFLGAGRLLQITGSSRIDDVRGLAAGRPVVARDLPILREVFGTCVEYAASIPELADRLESAGVPTIRVRPTGAAIRSALQTAALLGAHHRLEEAQLAVVIVDVPTLRESTRRTAPPAPSEPAPSEPAPVVTPAQVDDSPAPAEESSATPIDEQSPEAAVPQASAPAPVRRRRASRPAAAPRPS